MFKRFLFILLLLGFVISVPYDVFAAPRKETKKERRERLKRELKEKRKQRQNQIRISPRHKSIFESYGIEIVAENYTFSDQGKKLTQKDLDADVEHILYQFKLMGRKYVEMSKCRKIVIRGSHPKVAFASGNSLHFKYRTTGAIRHELFHSFDPFNFAYRYWKSLNHEDFYYIHGGRKGIFGNMTNREILCCFNNMKRFSKAFTWSYAQSNHREDVASIFNHTTDPKAAAKWLKRSRENKIFQKKFFTIIANCAEATGYEYWKNLYDFNDAEWEQIRNSYIDVGKEKSVTINYAKRNFRRYGSQRRATMALMALDNRMIQASGITRIQFSSAKKSMQLEKNTIIISDRDFNGLIEGFFRACYRRNPQMVKKHLQKSSRHTEKDWAVLFRKCVFDIRHIAKKSSTDPVLYKDILCLKNFTGKWLPDKFWQDILTLSDEYIADRHYQQQFDSYNITLNVPLPSGVTGESCSAAEVNNAKRIFIACSSMLNRKFINGTGIKNVAFVKNIKVDHKKIIGGVVKDGILCLDPTYPHLGRTVFYELFLRYDYNVKPEKSDWQELTSSPQDYISKLAKKSLDHDRAETFAWLLWNPYHAYQTATKSEILPKKIDLILNMKLLTANGSKLIEQFQ